ncbi:hypothetical protein [Lysinibacillus sp. OL1]|uniref:hypothetical protein n=2 Tax=unclassified Lysinibacillus TaxID=2636778 RepID=UPI00210289EA|nr:hypothetical protein [Lysinibacillus sp. OL1]
MNIQRMKKNFMFHPVMTYIGKFVTNFIAVDLHEDIFLDGTLVYESPKIQEIQSYAKQQLTLLWEEYKRLLNPAEYPVNLSQACWDKKMKNIEEVKRNNRQSITL